MKRRGGEQVRRGMHKRQRIASARDDQTSDRPTADADTPGTRSLLLATATTAFLFWAALPPLGWWVCGWIAPVGLAWIVVQPTLGSARRPYWLLWLLSALYWIVVLQGIRLAHWANYFGLLALGAYLGVYWPLFVFVARRAVHRMGVPLIIAGPVVWTGIEVARAYGPLGFSMALLAHTQTSRTMVIQIADVFGAYGVSFVLMAVASAIVAAARQVSWSRRVKLVLPALGLVGVTLGYGIYRSEHSTAASARGLRVALIQGSIDTVFDDDPDAPQRTLEQYTELTETAVAKYPPLDLVIWPESMFPINDIVVEPDVPVQTDATMPAGDIDNWRRAFTVVTRNMMRRLHPGASDSPPNASKRMTSWLLGTTTWRFGAHRPRRYNAAILIDADANIVGRYGKMHPVMFGEYVPLGETFPWLYRLAPMPNGLTPGPGAQVLTIADMKVSPSICFESTVPQLIRGHVADLARRGESPDVLVNLTNDGWFWGSSILDLHLDCAVFRAVELRRPLLIAANTGFSAWIDGSGRIRARGPRRARATLLATVHRDGRWSGYERWGDWPMLLCTAFGVLAVVMPSRRRDAGKG